MCVFWDVRIFDVEGGIFSGEVGDLHAIIMFAPEGLSVEVAGAG